MLRRALLSILAAVGILASSLHAPAMAVTMMPVRAQSTPVSIIPAEPACHEEAAKAPALKQVKIVKLADKAPAKADCCGDGCDNACSPVAAFFAAAPSRVMGFLRSVVEAEAVAKTPAMRPDLRERPPRPDA